jgi:hypothetical protein
MVNTATRLARLEFNHYLKVGRKNNGEPYLVLAGSLRADTDSLILLNDTPTCLEELAGEMAAGFKRQQKRKPGPS